MTQEAHAYELIGNYSKSGQVLGKVWWDGKSIQSDKKKFLIRLKHMTIHYRGKTLTFKNGPDFLDALPHHFRNGYMSVRKVA